MVILETRNLSRSFGGVKAVNKVDFIVDQGKTIGIIGPNGAGKTTLFNLLSGLDFIDEGSVHLDGHDITHLRPEKRTKLGLVRTFQHGRPFARLSVEDNLLLGAHTRRSVNRHLFSEPFKELFFAFFPFLIAQEEKELRAYVRKLLEPFDKRLSSRIHEEAYQLSYANRRRIEIIRALASCPKVLMLDEPTAGMNPSETLEMLTFLQTLKKQGQTMLIIEHKLALLTPLCDYILVMDNGCKIVEDVPSVVANNPQVIAAYLGKSHRKDLPYQNKKDNSHGPA